jgi:hypothetical protein
LGFLSRDLPFGVSLDGIRTRIERRRAGSACQHSRRPMWNWEADLAGDSLPNLLPPGGFGGAAGRRPRGNRGPRPTGRARCGMGWRSRSFWPYESRGGNVDRLWDGRDRRRGRNLDRLMERVDDQGEAGCREDGQQYQGRDWGRQGSQVTFEDSGVRGHLSALRVGCRTGARRRPSSGLYSRIPGLRGDGNQQTRPEKPDTPHSPGAPAGSLVPFPGIRPRLVEICQAAQVDHP